MSVVRSQCQKSVVLSVLRRVGSSEVTLSRVTSLSMCSLVEIKNSHEIYIHYLDTSDRADSIDSADPGDVTINNCSVVPPAIVTTDMAVQVDFAENKDRQEEKEGRKASVTTIGQFLNYISNVDMNKHRTGLIIRSLFKQNPISYFALG